MKKIYLMRHGETLFNTMDVNQGQCDSPLTENGIRQAKAAKAWFDAHNVHFDAVYIGDPLAAMPEAASRAKKPRPCTTP